MDREGDLVRSIVFTVLVLFVAQWVGFLAVATIAEVPRQAVRDAIVVHALVHATLLLFLLLMRRSFVLIREGTSLERVNVANVLTMSRISTTPTLLFLLILSDRYPLLPVLIVITVAVFLTDLFDGRIARRTGRITRMGQYLDSMSDYALLIAVSIAYAHFGLISAWFFRLVMVRFAFQCVAMASLLLGRRFADPPTTIGGKASVFAVMTLYAVALARIALPGVHLASTAFAVLERLTAVIVALSIVEKGWAVVNLWKQNAPTEP